LNDDNDEGDDAKDNHVESSLTNDSNSMSRNLRSKNTNSTSSHCPPYCWSKITLQLHDPQLCGYNPISGSTEV